MSDAAAVDWERQQKLKKTIPNKQARMNELQTESTTYQLYDERETDSGQPSEHSNPVRASVKSQKIKAEKSQIESELMDAVKQLREEVAELKRNVWRSSRPSNQFQSRTRRGCRGCQEKGGAEQCNHCFKCGLSGHLPKGCRAQGNSSGKSDSVNVAGQTVEWAPHCHSRTAERVARHPDYSQRKHSPVRREITSRKVCSRWESGRICLCEPHLPSTPVTAATSHRKKMHG